MGQHARIDDIVALLDASAPSALGALRSRYPEIAEELKLGLTLGETGRKDDNRRLHALAVVAATGMDESLKLASRAQEIAVGRLRAGSLWETVGQGVALVAAAVTTASAALLDVRWVTVATASISLAGSLTTLFAQYQKAGIGGSKDGILNSYAKLAALVPDVGNIRAVLRVLHQMADLVSRADEVEKHVARANELSRAVYESAAAIPGALALGQTGAAR